MWSWHPMLPVLEPRYRNAPKESTTPTHVFERCFFLFSLASHNLSKYMRVNAQFPVKSINFIFSAIEVFNKFKP